MAKRMDVKNRAPAPIQITAEQILREAKDKGIEDVKRPPTQFITDREELLAYQSNKRRDFENQIRRQRQHIGTWCRYGLWEASLKEFANARSVFERALQVDYRNQTLWFKYIEMEMKNKFVNHARNILDRAVALHPRVDKFWFKYTYSEEMMGAVEQARQVFERWMKWEPNDMAWSAYIKFEMRQGEIGRARGIFERYIVCRPTSRAYLKYAKWEENQNQRGFSRAVYERAMEEMHPDQGTERLLINFARFEERCKEYDRARVIYQYALDNIGKRKATATFKTKDDEETEELVEQSDEEDNITAVEELKREFIAFEKRHGNRKDIESVIVSKRRNHYEGVVKFDKYNYDAWVDYIKLEEAEGDLDMVRAVYDRAVDSTPPLLEKKYWKRYIYLWIFYALFEELQASDVERTREVYRRCLKVIPHRKFTFGKIWTLAAQFEVRQNDLGAARKILGNAIGLCPKENIFKGYIDLELQLGEIDRCRQVHAKRIEFSPSNCAAWIAFAQLEINVGETVRARSLFEIAVSQSELDMPELLWKAFIDFEVAEGDADRVRELYERLLDKTSHVKVWISYGKFECSCAIELSETKDSSLNEDEHDMELTRSVGKFRDIFERGYKEMKDQGLKEERTILLEAWLDSEESTVRFGGNPSLVQEKMPRKVKMRRMNVGDDGAELGWEEYYDYLFPDDEKKVGTCILK
jgi:crooked neck